MNTRNHRTNLSTIERIFTFDYGWAFLGIVKPNRKENLMDPRNYGFAKLTPLKSLTDILEIDKRIEKGIKHVFVRLRYS
jgi:hypothetical protein